MLRYALRLAVVGLSAWRAGRIAPLAENRTVHRCWLADCDPNLHMTEGGYLVVSGLARLSLWARIGLARAFVREGLRPAAVSTAAYFFREIPPFARFEVVSRLMTWDDKYMYFEHRFERGGKDAARVVVRSLFRNRDGTVPPARVLEGIGHGEPPPPFPEELSRWAQMREAARAVLR